LHIFLAWRARFLFRIERPAEFPEKLVHTPFAVSVGVSSSAVYAADSADVTAGADPSRRYPVKIQNANVAIDMEHLVFAGDAPFALGDLHLLADDVHDWNTKGNIVAVFHGDAAYVALNDDAYNVVRHVTTGNLYKEHMAQLMKEGVEIELCGASAKGNHRGNSNLLSGVKVNANAMVRLTQLERDGYKMIYD